MSKLLVTDATSHLLLFCNVLFIADLVFLFLHKILVGSLESLVADATVLEDDVNSDAILDLVSCGVLVALVTAHQANRFVSSFSNTTNCPAFRLKGVGFGSIP